jgi:pimeloyl-ACP methyl ester carboxylesterase
VDRVVLVGFSLGGLASILAADAPGIVGWVGLDPVDLRDHRGLEAARSLRIPATLVRAPATPCNAYGNAAPWSKVFAQPAGDTMLADATHCDFESPTDGWCRFFCGENDAARERHVLEALLAAVMARFEVPAVR